MEEGDYGGAYPSLKVEQQQQQKKKKMKGCMFVLLLLCHLFTRICAEY
jgi:hypothetical protein